MGNENKSSVSAIFNNMPSRTDGIWCDYCRRKFAPVEMMEQYPDSINRRWCGVCRSCSQKRNEEYKRLYYKPNMTDSEFYRRVSGHITDELLFNYYDLEAFLYCDRITPALEAIIIKRFGSLDNYYSLKKKVTPSRRAPSNELPL